MLHFMRCPLPSQCSLEGPLLLSIPDLVANPTWGGVSVYYGFLADLLEPEASSWVRFWVGVRLIWATPSQPGSLLGRETNLAVCLSSRHLLWKTYTLPPGWLGTQPSSYCISNTRTDATVLWGIKYTCLTYFHPANMQVMQRCGLDEELISDLSKSLKD